jgi:hypothetical protein
MSKTSCEKKNAKSDKEPKYECKNCGLSAVKDKLLCKPRKIKKK